MSLAADTTYHVKIYNLWPSKTVRKYLFYLVLAFLAIRAFQKTSGESLLIAGDEELPNLPIKFLRDGVDYADTCARLPRLTDVRLHNLFWQLQPLGKTKNLPKSDLTLYSAHLDPRPMEGEKLLRVLALSKEPPDRKEITRGLESYPFGFKQY